MNIKNVLDLILMHYREDDSIDHKILKEMNEAVIELEAAESMFNFVNDPNLIDAAIYREEAAKKKLIIYYLLQNKSILMKKMK